MKAAAFAKSNQRLRQARMGRCWSQAYVAERLGVDPFTVSRWERGVTAPSLRSRQDLCALFAASAAELDLLWEGAGGAGDSDRASRATQSGAVTREPPPLPPSAASSPLAAASRALTGHDDFGGADDVEEVLARIKSDLRAARGAGASALYGLARVAAALGEVDEARRLAWAGLPLFDEEELDQAACVRRWLARLETENAGNRVDAGPPDPRPALP